MKFYYVMLFMASFIFANSYSDSGNWEFLKSVDEFDESVTEFLITRSEKPIKGWLETGSVGIMVQCKDEEITPLFSSEIAFGTDLRFERDRDGTQVIRLRFDDEPAEKMEMQVPKEGRMLFFSKFEGDKMIKKIAIAKKLKIEVKMFNTKVKQVAYFDVTGFNEAVSQCSNK